MKSNRTLVLREYRNAVASTLATKQATEHSYRPALQSLVEGLGGNRIRAINEPVQSECGAPDFVVLRDGLPIGHIECKNVSTHLDLVQESEQMTRYRAGLSNLVLTDCLDFRHYEEGRLRRTARLGVLDEQDGIVEYRGGNKAIRELIGTFLEANPPIIADSRELAHRMASKARILRDGVERILKQEGSAGPLHSILHAYRNVLITGLSDKAFADMQAQTAAYGMFAARCIHLQTGDSNPFTRQTAIFTDTTPFLRDVFSRVAGPGTDRRIAWIVDDLAALLDRADMLSILADFGRRSRREDPVVHFYEDFLAAYDPKLREMRGVYYTPEPVVSYIVRSVNRILQDRFGLPDGLAATTSERNDEHQVLILDPAAGTGTFLREAISCIRETIESKGMIGAWHDYVRNHLLPRLYGFELLMAPYAICHLKLALEIGGIESGFRMPEGLRLGVYLTNTLEEPHEPATGQLFAHEIALEAASADSVKRDKPVMVVLGNPPYSGHSANKGNWIKGLIGRYKSGFPELTKPGQAKWLSDDYVKFIRFAEWRIARSGEGVLGFITNHAYLDNPTFRGMRKMLMETFDEIHVLDLHGSSKKKERTPDGEKDENVFDIQQGVAIGLFIKHKGSSDAELANVFHADLWGKRESGPDGGKYGWLAANDVNSTKWTELNPKTPQFLFVPRDEELVDEYELAWSIPDIFSRNGDPAPGIVTTHDQFAISWTPQEAKHKIELLLDSQSEEEARACWRLCSQSQWQYRRAKEELADGKWKDKIVQILYRPFDIRTTVFDRNVAVHRRERVMRHMRAVQNLGLISCRQQSQVDSVWSHSFVTNLMIESCAISNKTKEINYLFPLYISPQGHTQSFDKEVVPNLNPRFCKEIEKNLDLTFVDDKRGDLTETLGVEDCFHYIYAILYSGTYKNRFSDFLKFDFPRVPLTCDPKLFNVLVEYGELLIGLHLQNIEGSNRTKFLHKGTNRVERIRYIKPEISEQSGRVWINKTQCFEGVATKTWSFTVGSYRPAEKWLKDRKNRTLSFEDVSHYCRICGVIDETSRIVELIDRAIEIHGGWPIV